MHGREEHAEGNDPDQRLVVELETGFGKTDQSRTLGCRFPLLEEGWAELYPQHADVRHDAEGDLEQRRVPVVLAHIGEAPERDAPDTPPPADVDDDGQTGHGVAQSAGQQSGPHQRVVLTLVHDVAQNRNGVSTAGECCAGDDVKGDPDAPRVVIGEAGNDPDTEDESIQKNRTPDSEEDHHEGDELLVQGSANGLSLAMACHYPSSFFAAREFRHITSPRTP